MQKINKKNELSLLIVFACISNMFGQFHNEGAMHVADNSFVFVNSGNVTFGSSSVTSTSKSTPYSATNGKLILGTSAAFSTDGIVTKYVNGFTETRSTLETLLAIGSSSIYAPIKVTPVSNQGVSAAYFNSSPLSAFNGGLASDVRAVANTEYWFIKGVTAAVISLSWRSTSNLSSYSFPDITIVGYKNNKWELIPSAIDVTSEFGGVSSLSGLGSVTSSFAVTLSDYEAFAIGEKGVTCAELIVSSGVTKTWNGAWSPSAPTLADPVVIAAPYSAGSFACNSIVLNADVILTGTQQLEIVNGASGTGKVVLESEAGLVQRNSNATAPQIELTKTTRPMKRFDFVYWGAPVVGNVASQIDGAQAVGATETGAFDAKYHYVSGNTTASGGWQPLDATSAGKGFITRVKNQAPYVTPSTTAAINLKFTGVANNGDVIVPVANVSGDTDSARNNNLVANPYPSAIDASKFLTENNDKLDGVIYLWRSTTPNDGATTSAYSVNDYIAYTKAGSTAYSGTGTDNSFNGNIASGQGFKVKAIATGDIKFTNCMRVATAGSNSQFYRASSNISNPIATFDRYKLNIQTHDGIANQILVAYTAETTLNYDKMYDAELFSVSPTKLFSILDNSDTKLAINARPIFDLNDTIALGFSKPNAQPVQMKIAIADREGVFANNFTSVYLYDTQLGVYHNLDSGDYNFISSNLEDTNRFKIVYKAVLNEEIIDLKNVFVSLFNQTLQVNASSNIHYIDVFDITGRLILSNSYKDLSLMLPFQYSKGVYIVNIMLENGQKMTKKILNY